MTDVAALLADQIADAVIDRLRLAGVLDPSTPAPVERLTYSLAEAADALGVARSAFADRVRDGTIHAVEFGGRRLITRAELDRVLGEAS